MDPLKRKALASLGLALAAAVLAWGYFHARERELLRRGELVEVLVAKRYIPAYARIEKDFLALKEIPREYVPRGAALDYQDIHQQLSLVPFNAGEPILFNKLSPGTQALASSIPEGRRAFTMPVDSFSGLAGLVRPGDLVDLLFMAEAKASPTASASTLFQGVKVLAAGELLSQEEGKAPTGGSVTLALTPLESQLALFALSRGLLHLSLRPPGDTRLLPSAPVTQADLNARATLGLP